MNWVKAVSEASTHDSLLEIVNDYLLQHPEDFWSWVPKGSRPTLMATVEELHAWHRKLNDDLANATMPNVRMQDVCVFFVRASARAMEIARSSDERQSSNDDVEIVPHATGNGC